MNRALHRTSRLQSTYTLALYIQLRWNASEIIEHGNSESVSPRNRVEGEQTYLATAFLIGRGDSGHIAGWGSQV